MLLRWHSSLQLPNLIVNDYCVKQSKTVLSITSVERRNWFVPPGLTMVLVTAHLLIVLAMLACHMHTTPRLRLCIHSTPYPARVHQALLNSMPDDTPSPTPLPAQAQLDRLDLPIGSNARRPTAANLTENSVLSIFAVLEVTLGLFILLQMVREYRQYFSIVVVVVLNSSSQYSSIHQPIIVQTIFT